MLTLAHGKKVFKFWAAAIFVNAVRQTITEKTKRHIFKGEINRQGKAVGCRHVNAINEYKTAQLVPNTRKNGPNGLFKAKVPVKNVDG
ncbi:MAG: EndoU domain-containing protein, partial [Cytophagales bacterium]